MIYIDVKFLNLVSSRLLRYKIKKNTGAEFHAVCRCNICGDSAKDARKTRGNFYSSKGEIFYKCFNCGASTHFSAWLKDFDANIFTEYRLEKYAESKEVTQIVTKDYSEKVRKTIVPDIFASLKSVIQLSENHPARKMIENRKIPAHFHASMYYAPKFFEWTKEHTEKFENVITNEHPRWIIPWYNQKNEIIGYQARCFGAEMPKYYTIVLDKSAKKIYGMERVDFKERIYVVEGPIDSLMLSNCIAIGSSALHTFRTDETEATYVLDNENRNSAILKEYAKLIELGVDVCIMPDDWKFKDLNDAIVGGFSSEKLKSFIDQNTYNGLAAKIKLSQWRKVDF